MWKKENVTAEFKETYACYRYADIENDVFANIKCNNKSINWLFTCDTYSLIDYIRLNTIGINNYKLAQEEAMVIINNLCRITNKAKIQKIRLLLFKEDVKKYKAIQKAIAELCNSSNSLNIEDQLKFGELNNELLSIYEKYIIIKS